jgi:hypothetical protein
MLAGASIPAVEIQPIPGDFGPPRVVVPAPENVNYQHLGWPKMVRAANGDLVVCYVAGRKHTEGGSPACSVSRDRGKTFSKPHIVLETPKNPDIGHTWNVALGRVARKDLLLLAMVGDKERKTSRPMAWRSKDHGRSWVASSTRGLPARAFGVFGNLFSVPGRGIAVAGYSYMNAGKWMPGVWIAYSSDNGESWDIPGPVSMEVRNEPSFLYTANMLIGLVREEDPEPKTYRLFHSPDLGKTWNSAPVGFGNGRRLPSPFVTADAKDPARLYALESDRAARHIVLWTARAGLFEWSRVGKVAGFPSVPGSDYGYPWMVQLNRTDWFLVFYCGANDGPNHIWGMRIKLPPPAK